MRSLLTFAILVLLSAPSWAYIPTSRTIFNRTAHNNGRGFYSIEQEVTFHTDGEPLVLRENWIVENGESMRLTVTNLKGASETYRYDALYKEGRKWQVDAGQVRASSLPSEMFESYFHYRSGRGLLEALLRNKVIPANFAREPKRFAVNVKHTAEPALRLSRTGGLVAYAFGEPAAADSSAAAPGAWIEQDAFLLRKIRFPTQTEVVADKYQTAAAGLKFPRERTVSWQQNSVSIRVLSVKTLAESQARAQLNPNAFSQNKGSMSLPPLASVKEFYSRFR